MEIEQEDVVNKTTASVESDVLQSTTLSIKSNDNETSKSSIDSSFAVPEFHSSTLLERKLNVCEEVLDSKMAALELCENNEDEISKSKANGDGSDSGVEIGVSLPMNGVLQRALSSNSGGYASSCAGLEDCAGPVSCNSSMISYCSDNEKTSNTIVFGYSDCCASEGGSESSSITGGPTVRKQNCTAKKKVAVKEPSNRSPRKSNESTSSTRSRSRPPSVSRSNTLPSKSVAPNLATRERARSRDKVIANKDTPKSTMTNTQTRSNLSNKRPPKPDSFPVNIKDSTPTPRSNISRTPSISRGRTPLTTPTTDDGRWPSIGSRGSSGTGTPRSSRGTSVVPESLTIKTKIGNIQIDNKNSTIEKYATLPRRRKEKSAEDLKAKGSRSNSTNRESPINRMAASMIVPKKTTAKDASKEASTPTKSLPPYPKIAKKPVVPKTKIYHETSVQTAITCHDVEQAFSGGKTKDVKIDAVEMVTKETQSDIRDKEMEKMLDKIEKMNADYSSLLNKLAEKSQTVCDLEQKLLKEQEEKLAAQKELQTNTERVMHMIHNYQSGPVSLEDDTDSLLVLESKMVMSVNVQENQRDEIHKLQRICMALQRDMEKSLKIQDNLIRQKNELEEESTELQDFLQAEKVAFMEALKEAESENQNIKQKMTLKESELERQQEECRHLVRICEQRRQEYLGMQTRYTALENRSKDLLISQSAAVSGASVALSGLGNRLEHLVEQLITSYNISEQDLEDIVFYNEAYSNSCSSGDGSPEYETARDRTQSPQRGQSFLAAVINAIKNATSSSSKQSQSKKDQNKDDKGEESDSTEMLDSETEPCLMMEPVLEDVQMPDSHSPNIASASQIMLSQIEIPSDLLNSEIQNEEDNSLNDLSQAIANRQQIELQTGAMATRAALRQQSNHNSTSDDISGHESIAEVASIGDFCTAQSLVDQVIEVDNLVTKLLKVLRIIQLDNDNCIQELVTEKNKIAVTNDETQEKMKEWEAINQKLKSELKSASEQLIIKGNDLTSSKQELQRHRNEIDRLNMDICNLSTLCSEKQAQKIVDRDEILNALRKWQKTGNLPEAEIVSEVISVLNEIPTLKDKLREKDTQIKEITTNVQNSSLVMSSSFQKAVCEAKRQYDAIDRALETLHSIQSIVKDCPELAKLQRDLEETNFQTATSIPLSASLLTDNGNIMSSSDLNANETNGLPLDNDPANHNGNNNNNSESPGTQIIDSTA